MKYKLNESILLEADDTLDISPDADLSSADVTNTNTGNISDFGKAFAELDAKYKGKADQDSVSQHSEEEANLWSRFCKQTFGAQGEYVEETLLQPIKLECEEYGYTENTNPFISYLKILFSKEIEPSYIGYGAIHNAVVNSRVSAKDLRGNGELREKNIIFSNDLLDQTVADINKYLKIQTVLLQSLNRQKEAGNLKDVPEAFSNIMYMAEDEGTLRPLSEIEAKLHDMGIEAQTGEDTTLNVKVLQEVPEGDRAGLIQALLAKNMGTEAVAEAINMLKTDYHWTPAQLTVNVDSLNAKTNKQLDKLVKAAGINLGNLRNAIKELAKKAKAK